MYPVHADFRRNHGYRDLFSKVGVRDTIGAEQPIRHIEFRS
jgi:hypothetical protein